MTTAGSPGASRIRKKFKTMIASKTIAPLTMRWATNDSISRPPIPCSVCRSGRSRCGVRCATPLPDGERCYRAAFVAHFSSRIRISLVNPGVAEAVIDADRRRDKVLDPATGDGRKLQFEHPCHRHVVHQDFLRPFVDFLAPGIRRRDRAVG